MNQVVSAALVTQRKLEGEAAVAGEPSDDGSGPSPAGLDPGKAEPPAKPGPSKVESAQVGEVEQKKKVVQHPVYLSVPSCRGLDQDILVCRSYFSASL